MIGDKFFENVLHLGPPHRVVTGFGLWVIADVDRRRKVFHKRLDFGRRVKTIAAAVDDEHRFVAKIVREDLAVIDVAVGKDHDETIQRQKARIGRRIAHSDVIRAGAAVGNSSDDDAILIDVIHALDGIDNAPEVEDLIVAPPRRGIPGIRNHINLLGSR